MMKENYYSLQREGSAQRIQAVYRGYSVRKHFLAVRLRFERIVKSIEGTADVKWKTMSLCRPVFQDSYTIAKIKEIDKRKATLTQ